MRHELNFKQTFLGKEVLVNFKPGIKDVQKVIGFPDNKGITNMLVSTHSSDVLGDSRQNTHRVTPQ